MALPIWPSRGSVFRDGRPFVFPNRLGDVGILSGVKEENGTRNGNSKTKGTRGYLTNGISEEATR